MAPPQSKSSDDLDDEPGQYDVGTAAVVSLGDRLKSVVSGFRTGGSPDDPGRSAPMTDIQKRNWIRGLEPAEQRWGYLLGAYALLLSLIITLPGALSPHKVPDKGSVCGHHATCRISTQGTDQLFLVIELVLFLVIVGSTYFRKRSLLAFALLLSALASSTILGVPMLVGAGWLFLRAWRVQRYGSPYAKVAAAQAAEQRRTGTKPPGAFSIFRRRSTPTAASASVTTASTAGSTSSKTAGARSAPDASKRYTPKKSKAAEKKSRYAQAKAKAEAQSKSKK